MRRYDEVNVKKILEDTSKFENDVLEKSKIDSIRSIDQNVASNNNDEKNDPEKNKIDSILSIDQNLAFSNELKNPSNATSIPRRSQRNKLISNKTSQETTKPTEQQKLKQTTKNNAVISTTQMTAILWRELTLKGFDIEIGMIVCAKMVTFWPWPAQVIKFQKNRARVKFFGDLREGSVVKNQCVPFINCHHIIFNYISTIDKVTRDNFKRNVIGNLSEPRNIRHKPLKEQYLQSIKDVELYLGSQNKLLSLI